MSDIDLTNIHEVKKLMNKHGTGAKKSFGQNFLVSPSVPKRIAFESQAPLALDTLKEIQSCSDAGVIEIGAGIGALSRELCGLYKKVVAIELDITLAPILDEVFGDKNNFKVVFSDILKVDLKDLIKHEFDGCKKINICANLPYYITTPVITYILESGINFGTITLMIQKEAAARLCAKPGSEDYGETTVLVNYYGSISKLFDVSPSSFYPPPKVTSTVIRIVPHEARKISPELKKFLFRIVRAAFEQRRKTLSNAIYSAFEHDKIGILKADISDAIEKITGNANVRGEILGFEEFINISKTIFSLFRHLKQHESEE